MRAAQYHPVVREFTYPANTRRSPDAGLMLVHRLRRWPNIKPASGERFVIAGYDLLRDMNVLIHGLTYPA